MTIAATQTNHVGKQEHADPEALLVYPQLCLKLVLGDYRLAADCDCAINIGNLELSVLHLPQH